MTVAEKAPASAPSALPDGVYRGDDGKHYRTVKRITRGLDGSLEYELIPRECLVISPYETDESVIHEARERAARRGLDFYDPRIVEGQVVGWLDRGRKRQEEWPANRGSNSAHYERIPVPADENPDVAAGIAPKGKEHTNGK